MSPASNPPSRRTRRPGKQGRATAGGPRDLVEAFGKYYDRVERDAVGNLTVTCSRCKVQTVIAFPHDPTYVLAQLRRAHERHNHALDHARKR